MNSSDQRPNPDALLRRVQAEEARRTRAKLKIFLGYAPGVGKTYKMLELARDLFVQDIDIVIGYVQVHQRFDTTSLVLGLDILPRRSVVYRGARMDEFDLEAALARKPQILLVDELAHSNAPGGRHGKRWQDVFDLLDAGIEVHTTLNVQHVESLNDVVAQITGIRVRETVPDSVLERADEIELVDCPPDELLARLMEGKVYLPEQAARATESFFKRGNLLALRELALRIAALHAGADVQEYRQAHEIEATWPTAERILVCVGPSPASARLVRSAYRMAAGLRAPWTTIYVENPAPLTDADRQRLEGHLRLAESMGSDVVRLPGGHASRSILNFAREHNVTRIILGKPTHARYKDLLRGSLLGEIVRGSRDIDVHVISGWPEPEDAEDTPRRSQSPADWRGYAWAGALVGLATAVAVLARNVVALPDLVMLYLLVIMIVAVRHGRAASILASALSVLAYDFFSVPPYYTFSVHDQRHVLTFVMMFGVGYLISTLTLRIRRDEQEARRSEHQTSALYALSRDLGSALEEEHVAFVLAEHAAEVSGSGAVVLLPDVRGKLALKAKAGRDLLLETQELTVAQWVYEHGRPAGRGTDTLSGARIMCMPLRSGPETLGVFALGPERAESVVDPRSLLDAFARQAALALERARLAEEAKAAALRARSEEMRSSLLAAVSHDLRTPLGAITGAASELRDGGPAGTETQRRDLIHTICDEAERLERMVGNLLEMTRLESGTLEVKRDWFPLEEVVGSVLNRLEGKLAGREVHVELPPDLPLLSADPVLLEQVFINLLENAVKYTPPRTPLEIRARTREQAVEVEVADRGPGIPQGQESQVLEKFFRGNHAGVAGTGLGLAVCRGIVEAHGGTLVAENREGGGAVFRFSLPQVSPPPAPVPV